MVGICARYAVLAVSATVQGIMWAHGFSFPQYLVAGLAVTIFGIIILERWSKHGRSRTQ